ncbi:MAG: hypothetical protein IT380_07805 [Myxococcales bacterium]|nr:hypothetical protein [Myxococcales bacterium]
MKARSVSIYGALAVVGLSAAYLTWQRPKETVKADQVTVLEATKQSLEQVHFDDGTRFVDVARRAGDGRLWVTLGYLEGKRPVVDAGLSVEVLDGGAPDGGALPVTVKTPEPPPNRTTRANERGDTLWGRFTPFVGTRALGVLPDAKLDELGLVNSGRTLELTIAGATRRLVASKPVSGIIGSYVMDEKTKEVFLLPSTVFSELDPSSTLLVDRRLHTFKQSEFDAFTVKLGATSGDFVQTGADVPVTAKVAKKASPDKPDEMAKNWHDKIWNRLIVTEVLGEGEVPKVGEPKPALRIDYSLRGAAKGWLEVGTDPAGGTWARSENTATWVLIHQGAEELVLEAKKIIAP